LTDRSAAPVRDPKPNAVVEHLKTDELGVEEWSR
jgi:hypothetical protein